MTANPKKSITPRGIVEKYKSEVAEAAEGGLGDLTLREILGMVLTDLGEAERGVFLSRQVDDKGNGGYWRSLALGSLPVEIKVPRTRSGQFRPSLLPPHYQRSYPAETQNLLLGLLTSSRSLNAAKAAMKQMGLSLSEDDLQAVATEFIEELELRNTRAIDPDLLALFADAKFAEVREGDRLRTATIYQVVSLGRDGKKRVLSCVVRFGRENLEEWKVVFRNLIERGLRLVMTIVHDDFSGLLGISKGLFPQSDIQLCVVHLQRNAGRHMTKIDNTEFQQRIRAIKAAWDEEVGAKQFEDLCQRFEKSYPTFIAEIRKKKEHYLCFLKYPEAVRRTFSTNNVVEAVNGRWENIRRNNGGYFQSEEVIKLKLGMSISYLENGSWRKIASSISSSLSQLNAMFESKFEK